MESRLSWHRAVQSAKEFDTWVICQPLQHDCQGRQLPPRPQVDGLEILEITPAQDDVKNPVLFYRAYHAYQKQVLQFAKRLHGEIQFDLVHQVSFCGYREPGYLWQLGVPFVWGPVGGTHNFPLPYLGEIGLQSGLTEIARNVANWWQLRYRERVRKAANSAALVMAANSTTQDDLAKIHGVSAELQLETGLESLPKLAARNDDLDSLHILWSGRYCHWKALPLLLRALHLLKDDCNFRLRLMGYGPEEARLRKQVDRLGLANRTQFVGWPTYSEQMEHYAWADLSVFTSLRDTSGTGLLEALAHGCPIVAVDHQGAADIVTEEAGIRVPVSSPNETVLAIQSAIKGLDNDRELLAVLSRGARARAADFLWDRLGGRMRELYRRVLGQGETIAHAYPATATNVSRQSADSSILMDEMLTRPRLGSEG